MKTVSFVVAVLAAAASVLAGPSVAQDAVRQTVVYIQCTDPAASNDLVRRSIGSGVVVSELGHVLTARHVVPSGWDCAGNLGTADKNALKQLIAVPTVSLPVDVALLQFAEEGSYAFAPVCRIENWMIRREIFSAGFPERTGSFAPSFRLGVLSTVRPNSLGMLETDSMTIRGMSGGPVFTRDLKALVGIVLGGQPATTGGVNHFGILPVAPVMAAFAAQTANPQPCYRKSRLVDLPKEVADWHAGKGPLSLGVKAEEGVCHLAGVRGILNDENDAVVVTLRDGEYVLEGQNFGGGQLGAEVRCLWND